MTGPLLSADEIRELLVELGSRLAADGIEGRLFVVGGAAMALAYSRERVTRDVDAIFEPKTVVYDAATALAAERRIPPDWLNDSVKELVPALADGGVTVAFSAPGITVQVAGPEYLFAMKAFAARVETDGEDLRTLAGVLGVRSVEQAMEIVVRHYGAARLSPKTGLLLEELFGS
jgi:predicted nucleotidyltransferase